MLMGNNSSPILATTNLRAGYGKQNVLNEVSITVNQGEIVAILGHNGAGKTTLLKTVFGIVLPTSGAIIYENKDNTHSSYLANVEKGISFTPAEKNVFAELSVEDNLELGGISVKNKSTRKKRISEMFALFPLLEKRKKQFAGLMSGGEQRLLSLAIALLPTPKLLLLDEPSLGLAPSTAQNLFFEIANLVNRDGLSIIIVEQNIAVALRIAHRVYYMRSGEMILEELAEKSRQREHYWDLF
jgi:branched-chain amino acid transport system ATP-binding protein